MLRPNNPDIDFDTLNTRIKDRLDSYRATEDHASAPAFVVQTAPQASGSPATDTQAFVTSLGQLLTLEGETFVQQAYLFLLGREADSEGLVSYTARLNEGEEKANILASLRYSPEGRMRPDATPDLRNIAIKQRLRRLPVIGRLFRMAFSLLRLPEHLRIMNSRISQVYSNHEQQLRELIAENAQLKQQLQQQQEYQAQQHQQLSQKLAEQQADNQQQVGQLKLRLNSLSTQPQPVPPAPAAASPAADASGAPSVEDAFYLAFENHFRGDEADIMSRLGYYIPLLQAQAAIRNSEAPVVDIGCGRGEWLDMLKTEGFRPVGVDLNSQNIQLCQQKGHQAEQANGLSWLSQQPDNSIAAISSFHVIEHLTFEQYNQLLVEAIRVLIPGGMLILETPNPENLITGITHFYTDPTHLKPVPPALSHFMLDYRGFTDVQIHRRQPIPEEYQLIEQNEVDRRCNTLFYGEQDYAVIGCKPMTDAAE